MVDLENIMGNSTKFHDRSKRSYGRARRHSKLVSLLKVVFPLVSALAISGFIGFAVMTHSVPDQIVFDSTELSNGEFIMNNPKMSGQTAEARSYLVQAEKAVQNLTQTDIVTLHNINADMPIGRDNMASVTAPLGVYNKKNEFIMFEEPFQVVLNSGLTAELQSASYDIRKGALKSDAPVTIVTKEATISANSMKIVGSGQSVVFEENVQMIINPTIFNNKTTNKTEN